LLPSCCRVGLDGVLRERRGLAGKGEAARAASADAFILGDPGRQVFIPGNRRVFEKIICSGERFSGNKIGFAGVTYSRAERLEALEGEDRARFEAAVLPHLDAAFNLARWLLRSRADAEDVTQDALLRAYRAFGSYRSGNARAWLLQIVRNTCFTRLRQNRKGEDLSEFDENRMPQEGENPETLAIASRDREQLVRALEALPAGFREILVLRELEGCSYKEIAEITARPIGTVMSALARARQQLRDALMQPAAKEARRGL
jgi:RNA polymerase sigma-70 factor (ECF subfamily)